MFLDILWESRGVFVNHTFFFFFGDATLLFLSEVNCVLDVTVVWLQGGVGQLKEH